MPLYVEHFRTLHERLAVFLSAHGIHSAQLSLKNMYSSDRIIEFARMVLPTVIGLFSDRLLISLLSLIFLIEMVDPEGATTGPLARNLSVLWR